MVTPLYYPTEDNALQKTLGGDLSSGVTASVTLNNTNKIQDKPGVMVIDRIDTNGDLKTAAEREYISYTGVSGSTLTGLTRELGGSTDQDHSTGAVVEFLPDVTVFQSIIDALSTLVDADDVSVINSSLATLTGTQTLTNKTLTSPKVNENVVLTSTATELDNLVASVTTATSDATPNPTGGSKRNEYYLTALEEAAEFAEPSGTPANGNMLMIRTLDDGTGRALTYNDIYDGLYDTLPATTTASKTLYMLFIYNSEATKWEMVAYIEEE